MSLLSVKRRLSGKPWFDRVRSYWLLSNYNLSTLIGESTSGDIISPNVPRTIEEYKIQKDLKPDVQPANSRFLQVAIIGTPNAGKSTLTNKLIGWRVCSVSKKVHTTRYNTNAVMTVNNTQIVFLDTPGIITPEMGIKHKLEPSLVTDPGRSLDGADLIGVIVDAANKWTRNTIDSNILNLLLKNKDKSSFLVLNKCDCIRSKESLLDVVRNLTGGVVGGKLIAKQKTIEIEDKTEVMEKLFIKTKQVLKDEKLQQSRDDINPSKNNLSYSGFDKFFMVSARKGQGLGDILEYLNLMAKPRRWRYHPDVITNQSPQEIAVMALRGQLLDEFASEIPYNLKIEIEMWRVEEPSVLRIAMSIYCHKPHLLKNVIGPGGRTINKIKELTRQELADTFRCDVYLKVIVAGNKIK